VSCQESDGHSSASSVELFADVSHKAAQRNRATVSAAAVSAAVKEDKKRQCRKPRVARKIREPQQQQARKLPSFSEFDDYSLLVEGKNYNVVNTDVQEDWSDRQCTSSNSNAEMVSHVDNDEVFEPVCWRHSDNYSVGYASLSTSAQHSAATSRTVARPITTSTPHSVSVMRTPEKMYNKLVECTSQLQLSAVTDAGEITNC